MAERESKLEEKTKTKTAQAIDFNDLIQRLSVPLVDGEQSVNVQLRPNSIETVLNLPMSSDRKDSITQGEVALESLKTFKNLLSSDLENVAEFGEKLAEMRTTMEESWLENMQKVFDEQKELETNWRTLDAFITHGGTGSGVNLSLVNVSTKQIFENPADFDKFFDGITKESSLNMPDLYSMIVFPEWIGGDPAQKLQKVGEAAKQRMALSIVAAPENFDELFSESKEGPLKDLRGSDEWKQHVTLVGNDIRVRERNSYESDSSASSSEGIFVPSAVALAAMIHKADIEADISRGSAGAKMPLAIEGSPREEYDDQARLKDVTGGFVNVVAKIAGVTSFFGVSTMSDDPVFKQYPAVRVKQQVAKVVKQHVIKQLFAKNDPSTRRSIKDAINKYLASNSGNRGMLEAGRCNSVEAVPGKPSEITIDIELRYKNALDFATISFTADTEEQSFK